MIVIFLLLTGGIFSMDPRSGGHFGSGGFPWFNGLTGGAKFGKPPNRTSPSIFCPLRRTVDFEAPPHDVAICTQKISASLKLDHWDPRFSILRFLWQTQVGWKCGQMRCSALLWGILFCISLHLAMRPGQVDLKGTRISWRPLNKEWGTSPKVWSKFPVKIGVVSSSCWVGSPVGLRKWCPLLRWSMLYLRIPQCFRSSTCTTLGTAVEIGELFSTANSKLQDRQPGVELKHPFKF